MSTDKAQKATKEQTMRHTAAYVVTNRGMPVCEAGEMVVYTSRSAAQEAAGSQPMRCSVEMVVIKGEKADNQHVD
ncbi:hypothetical protein EXE43_11125 [Halorubrum sp. SS5]|jgi:hypothetical protein|nr:hypothetical protein EXE43_11125 [Halorubrum sp. SS5]